MSFYGSVYYQLIDTFYKMIVKNSGDNTYSFNDSLVNDSDKIATGVLDESPAVGRKGVFSLDSGNYWINFSKDKVYEDKDNDGEAVAAPYKIWHSKPHLKTEGEGEEEKILNPRVSGWDIQDYKVDKNGYEAENGDIILKSDNSTIKKEDYTALKNGDFLKTYPSYYDEAGHLIVEKTEPVLYRLPEAQNLFDEIGINNKVGKILEFYDDNNTVDIDATAKGPSTKLTFTPGNDWIQLSGEVENIEVNGQEVPCGNIYHIWHNEPREEKDEEGKLSNPRISGWDYAPSKDFRDTDKLPSQYTITYEIKNVGQANETKTEVLITDPDGKEIYNREDGTQDFIELREQDFLKIYPAYYDKAGHSFVKNSEEAKGIIYRLPKSAATELAELVGQPKVPIGNGIWFDNIPLEGKEQNDTNSILDLFDYAEKNFENITELREKFGIIKSDKKWDLEEPLSVLIGTKTELQEVQDKYNNVDTLKQNANIFNFIKYNKVQIDELTDGVAILDDYLGDPLNWNIGGEKTTAFQEIENIYDDIIGTREIQEDEPKIMDRLSNLDKGLANEIIRATNAEKDINDKIGSVDDGHEQDTVYGAIAKVKRDILTGGEDGNLKDTYDTLLEIQNWIEGDGVNATELTQAIANETARAENAEEKIAQFDENGTLVGGALYDEIASAKEEINTNITLQGQQIGSNTTQIVELNTIVEEGQTTITSLTEMINTMNGTIDALQSKIDELEGRLKDLEDSSEEGTV